MRPEERFLVCICDVCKIELPLTYYVDEDKLDSHRTLLYVVDAATTNVLSVSPAKAYTAHDFGNECQRLIHNKYLHPEDYEVQ